MSASAGRLELSLERLWDGRPAPRLGGPAWLELDGGGLSLGWSLALASPPRLPAAAPGYCDRLWEFDVVELFLTGASHERYLELEFGPGGHWLALGFEGVRRRSAELRGLAPRLANRCGTETWSGSAGCAWEPLERWLGGRPRRLLLTAILAAARPDAEPHHLSWPRVPGLRPDFHQPQAWADWPAGLASQSIDSQVR